MSGPERPPDGWLRAERRNRAWGSYYLLTGAVSVVIGVLMTALAGLLGIMILAVGVLTFAVGLRRWRRADENELRRRG